jgi:drug/metabolite transporter (DMT)-like permease
MAYLLLPFTASLLYVVGALFLKDASSRGVGFFRLTAFTNLFFGVVFSLLWVLGGQLLGPAAWLQPAATAALFLVGQVFAVVALQRGDVSVATPVMGLKVILVAFFVTLIVGERVPLAIWIAAALSSAGIVLLSRGGGATPGSGRTAPALVFGGLAAAAFALFDVLVQKWSPDWGAGRFLPIMMGFVALYSVLPFAWRRDHLGVAPLGSWRPLLLAGLCLAVQGALLISSLALYAQATTINVVYSARGLWSVLAVWVVGHWFGNRERELGGAVFRARLVGAGLLLAAILLVVVRR